MAIIGTDPMEKENNDKTPSGHADFDKPGPHRFIGVGMVAGMIFIALVLWVMLGKWPRRMGQKYGCYSPRQTESEGKAVEGAPMVRTVRLEGTPEDGHKHQSESLRTDGTRRMHADHEYMVKYDMSQVCGCQCEVIVIRLV